jgi:hypothetical protein
LLHKLMIADRARRRFTARAADVLGTATTTAHTSTMLVSIAKDDNNAITTANAIVFVM